MNSQLKPPAQGHVVEEFMIGNTRIKICDDAYRDKTPEELEKVHERIAQACWQIVMNARAKGKNI